MKAWHFVGNTLRDGRPVPADGVKLTHRGRIKMCQAGLHFSLEPFDALHYAPGHILCYVECQGNVQLMSDKGVCRERTIIKRINVRELLYDFGCKEAWAVTRDKNPPAIVEQYLLGDATTRDKTRAAARAAAWDVAWDAAWEAVQDVAWAAARDAARAAAWDVAWAAARARQRQEFNSMVKSLFKVQ